MQRDAAARESALARAQAHETALRAWFRDAQTRAGDSDCVRTAGANVVAWDDVTLCNVARDAMRVDAAADDDVLSPSFEAHAYVLLHDDGRPLALVRGADAAGATLESALCAAVPDGVDPRGATPLLRAGYRAAPCADDVVHAAPQRAYFLVNTPETTPQLRQRLPLEPGATALYLDALLEIYEMMHYEGVAADSREFVRRFAAMHARLFDLESARGRAADAAGAALLPYVAFSHPHLEPLVTATLGHFLLARLQVLFPGETRLGAACVGASASDAAAAADVAPEQRNIYGSIAAPAYARHAAPNGAPLECAQPSDAQIEQALASFAQRVLASASVSALTPAEALAACKRSLVAAQRRFDAVCAAARRASAAVPQQPRRFYWVPALRDAADLWARADAADAAASGVGEPPVAVAGYTFVHYLELPLCLVRRAQHHYGTLTRTLRCEAHVGAPLGLLSAADLVARDAADVLAHRHMERLAAKSDAARARPQPAYQRARTHRELVALVTQTRAAFEARMLAPYGAPGVLPRFFYEADLAPTAARAYERFAEVQRRTAREHRGRIVVPTGVEESAERLVEHAWAAMPPCYARMVTRAFASDIGGGVAHPKYDARIRLALFLFYGGWPYERALALWRLVFSSACRYARDPDARQFAQHSEYARHLETLYAMYRSDLDEQDVADAPAARGIAHARDLALPAPASAAPASAGAGAAATRRGGPASCRTLCDLGFCPMAQVDKASAAATTALRDEFAYVPDVEEAHGGAAAEWHAPLDAVAGEALHMRAQRRCARLYAAAHPGDGAPVAHPVAFYERALSYAAHLAPRARAAAPSAG